jgi:hypothetical protein
MLYMLSYTHCLRFHALERINTTAHHLDLDLHSFTTACRTSRANSLLNMTKICGPKQYLQTPFHQQDKATSTKNFEPQQENPTKPNGLPKIRGSANRICNNPNPSLHCLQTQVSNQNLSNISFLIVDCFLYKQVDNGQHRQSTIKTYGWTASKCEDSSCIASQTTTLTSDGARMQAQESAVGARMQYKTEPCDRKQQSFNKTRKQQRKKLEQASIPAGFVTNQQIRQLTTEQSLLLQQLDDAVVSHTDMKQIQNRLSGQKHGTQIYMHAYYSLLWKSMPTNKLHNNCIVGYCLGQHQQTLESHRTAPSPIIQHRINTSTEHRDKRKYQQLGVNFRRPTLSCTAKPQFYFGVQKMQSPQLRMTFSNKNFRACSNAVGHNLKKTNPDSATRSRQPESSNARSGQHRSKSPAANSPDRSRITSPELSRMRLKLCSLETQREHTPLTALRQQPAPSRLRRNNPKEEKSTLLQPLPRPLLRYVDDLPQPSLRHLNPIRGLSEHNVDISAPPHRLERSANRPLRKSHRYKRFPANYPRSCGRGTLCSCVRSSASCSKSLAPTNRPNTNRQIVRMKIVRVRQEETPKNPPVLPRKSPKLYDRQCHDSGDNWKGYSNLTKFARNSAKVHEGPHDRPPCELQVEENDARGKDRITVKTKFDTVNTSCLKITSNRHKPHHHILKQHRFTPSFHLLAPLVSSLLHSSSSLHSFAVLCQTIVAATSQPIDSLCSFSLLHELRYLNIDHFVSCLPTSILSSPHFFSIPPQHTRSRQIPPSLKFVISDTHTGATILVTTRNWSSTAEPTEEGTSHQHSASPRKITVKRRRSSFRSSEAGRHLNRPSTQPSTTSTQGSPPSTNSHLRTCSNHVSSLNYYAQNYQAYYASRTMCLPNHLKEDKALVCMSISCMTNLSKTLCLHDLCTFCLHNYLNVNCYNYDIIVNLLAFSYAHTLKVWTYYWKKEMYVHVNPPSLNVWMVLDKTLNNQTFNMYSMIRNNHSCMYALYDIDHFKKITTLKSIYNTSTSFSMIMLHSAPQIKLWGGVNHEIKRRNSTSHKNHSILTQNFFIFSMSQRPTSSTSSQRYKDKLTALDNDTDTEMFVTQKRNSSSTQGVSSQKKAKGKSNPGLKRPPFWLGYQAMNWTNRGKGYPMDSNEPVATLVKNGMREKEAKECQSASISFPFVIQEEWPNSREDGKDGQHFNLTQIPSDVEVDKYGFSFDYQIAIIFEMEEKEWEKEIIMSLVEERLKEMNIMLGDIIGEPIAIMCYHKSTKWSGVIKLHLKNPEIDGMGLLQGLRPFILQLDNEKFKRGKICKTYDSLALNNLLSVKVTSAELEHKEWYELYEKILVESFKRGMEYEITNVQKKKENLFAWVVAASPGQAQKMKEHKITYNQEILEGKLADRANTKDDIARKNALILIAKNLNKTKSVEEIEASIETYMGPRNAVSFFFKRDEKNGKHLGSCNIQCLNATVYKTFVKKSAKLLGKHVEFTAHPRSLDGANPPNAAELTRLGFSDVNTALANTIEAIGNSAKETPQNDIMKEIVGIREEISTMKKELRSEQQQIAEKAVEKSSSSLTAQMTILRRQLASTMQALDEKSGNTLAIEDGNMDTSN